jgi:hypothetical protein
MAEIIEEERPRRETVIVDKREGRPRSNTGVIIAVVILAVLILLLLFGRGLFRGASKGTNTNIQTPAPLAQ